MDKFKTVISLSTNKYIAFRDDDAHETDIPILYSNIEDDRIIQYIDDFNFYGISKSFKNKYKIIELIILRK